MAPNYIQAVLNDAYLRFVGDEVDELYTDVSDVRGRLEFLGIVDNEYLSYHGEDEE